jgi:hypothetical protein
MDIQRLKERASKLSMLKVRLHEGNHASVWKVQSEDEEREPYEVPLPQLQGRDTL